MARIEGDIDELLEVIASLQEKGGSLRDVLKAYPGEAGDAMAALRKALADGLVEERDGGLRLTEKGLRRLLAHRERFIHEKYGHPRGVLGRLSRIIEGKVGDLRAHWWERHGIDRGDLDAFYSSLTIFKGRIEDTVPLSSLKPGESGIVSYYLGGKGLLRRLAEMGLTPGVEVSIVKTAPLRGPVQVSVRGYSLALGRGVASRIFVKPLRGHGGPS
ncbi:MAG: FeoA domain-containing protein [Candidatus Bathyarchaeia archaeon]